MEHLVHHLEHPVHHLGQKLTYIIDWLATSFKMIEQKRHSTDIVDPPLHIADGNIELVDIIKTLSLKGSPEIRWWSLPAAKVIFELAYFGLARVDIFKLGVGKCHTS